MGQKAMLSIVVSVLCYSTVAYQKPKPTAQYDKVTTTTGTHKPEKPAKPQCDSCNEKDNDQEVQQMAISTLASMANSLLNIGADPHNPQAIGAGVIGIISSFINFVTFALKHPEIAELMKDELFQEALRSYIARTLVAKEVDG